MIHDMVADEIAGSVTVFLAPTAVEGQSAGDHRTDVVSPISAEEAIMAGVPYMIAEVKAYGASNRREARKQLQVAEAWAEQQGAEVIRVGAPDAEGNPQMDNPQYFANGQVQFPASGVFELYPNMFVVYRLSEPGVYEYRVYATGPLPDPDQPLTSDSSLTFRQQLNVDYYGVQEGRPTPENVQEAEGDYLDLPGQTPGAPLPPRRFS